MRASERAIRLIQEFEPFTATPQHDGHKDVIGYGHVCHGEKRMSESEAVVALCHDLEAVEACIEGVVDVELTQGQFDALCSLVLDLGRDRFLASSLLRRLNAGDYQGAVNEFVRLCRVGNHTCEGRLTRRLAEQLLFRETP